MTMLTRKALDWTKPFGPAADVLAKQPTENAHLGGEIANLGPDGVSSTFSQLSMAPVEVKVLGPAYGHGPQPPTERCAGQPWWEFPRDASARRMRRWG